MGELAVTDPLIVLIAEDEPLMQGIVEENLREGGFDVAMAPSGEEAVILLKSRQIAYRGLITDINLIGKVDGWELARAAREIHPEIPVVYMTGAAADQWASRGVPNSILLQKPFAPAQLITAISQLMNAAPPREDG